MHRYLQRAFQGLSPERCSVKHSEERRSLMCGQSTITPSSTRCLHKKLLLKLIYKEQDAGAWDLLLNWKKIRVGWRMHVLMRNPKCMYQAQRRRSCASQTIFVGEKTPCKGSFARIIKRHVEPPKSPTVGLYLGTPIMPFPDFGRVTGKAK